MGSTSVTVFAIVLLCVFVGFTVSHELPKDFARCHTNDNDCILKRMNDIVHNHPNGYPELLLPIVEPFPIGDVKLTGNPNSPVNFNLEMSDLKLHGYANITFTKTSGYTNDPKNIQIESEGVHPQLIIKGKYKISGNLLVLPITGEGNIELTVDGLHMKSQVKQSAEVRDGKTYLKLDSFKLKTKADNLNIHMTNLFNGDKVLSENMLKIMNENWKLLWDEVEPKLNEQIAKANAMVIDSILNKIPYNKLFIID